MSVEKGFYLWQFADGMALAFLEIRKVYCTDDDRFSCLCADTNKVTLFPDAILHCPNLNEALLLIYLR